MPPSDALVVTTRKAIVAGRSVAKSSGGLAGPSRMLKREAQFVFIL